MLRDTPTRQ